MSKMRQRDTHAQRAKLVVSVELNLMRESRHIHRRLATQGIRTFQRAFNLNPLLPVVMPMLL
jgi:hypothetical protein